MLLISPYCDYAAIDLSNPTDFINIFASLYTSIDEIFCSKQSIFCQRSFEYYAFSGRVQYPSSCRNRITLSILVRLQHEVRHDLYILHGFSPSRRNSDFAVNLIERSLHCQKCLFRFLFCTKLYRSHRSQFS